MTEPIGTPSPYLIHCVKDEDFGSCGASSFLTEEEYLKQLGRPDTGWRCPQCSCYPCGWDDANSAKYDCRGDTVMSLDEWIEANGLRFLEANLRDNAENWISNADEVEAIVRCNMIMVRQELADWKRVRSKSEK